MQWILQQRFGVAGVNHLLDDLIFVDPAASSVCLHSLQSFELLSQLLGVPLNNDKRCLPSTCPTVYGIKVDTAKKELRLPAKKIAIVLVDSMVKCRKTVSDRFPKFCLLSGIPRACLCETTD